jgi:hypothetical protein
MWRCGPGTKERKFSVSVSHQLNEEIKFKVNFALVKQRQTQTY